MFLTISLLILALVFVDSLNMVYSFQLESYNILSFVKSYLKKLSIYDFIFKLVVVVLLLLNILFDNQTILIIETIFLLLENIIKLVLFTLNNSKNKIKLKYTKRVLRLLFVIISIVMLTNTIMFLTKTYVFEIVFIFDVVVFVFASILVLPLEKCVYTYYMYMATRKLKKMDDLKIIAITGSYGKTSVKNILASILGQKYNVCATPMSYNTPMGICRCVLSDLKPYHNILVLEFGAKKLGEIEYLCKKFCPGYGIITSVGSQHLETFKSVENITKTKMELFDFINNKSHIVCNVDNQYIRDYLVEKKCQNIVACGLNGEVLCFENRAFVKEKSVGVNGSSFLIESSNNGVVAEAEKYNTKLIGEHNILNISLAIAMAKVLGLNYVQILQGLSQLVSIEHRLELKNYGDYLVIDNAYNSNPHSFRCAIDTLCLFDGYRKIVITPGVVEQGRNSYEENYKLGKYMADRVGFVYVVNKTNRNALLNGIKDGEMIIDKIAVVDKFADIDWSDFGLGDVVLIENDLPDNYD